MYLLTCADKKKKRQMPTYSVAKSSFLLYCVTELQLLNKPSVSRTAALADMFLHYHTVECFYTILHTHSLEHQINPQLT